MVILLAALLALLTVGFLLAPFLFEDVRAACSQDALDRIDADIEDEIRAFHVNADQ